MINLDTVRRLLAAADANRHPYAVAEGASALLSANPHDSNAAAHYARAMIALQLFTAAQRVIGAPPPQQASGIVRWASRARRFAANVAALESRDPEGAQLVREAATKIDRYELHSAADGNFQVLDTTLPLHAGWLATLGDHKGAESQWQFDREKTPVPPPIAFAGIGFGWLLPRVLESTRHSYLQYSCPIYILEQDPLALAIVLHVHDFQEIIRSPRVRWFVRASAEEALGAFRSGFAIHPEWSLPNQIIRCPFRPVSGMDIESVVAELSDARTASRDKFLAQANTYYNAKGANYWARRFDDAVTGIGEPLRVLGITCRYTTVLQHSMAEMRDAVNAAGHDMRIAIETDDHSLENPWPELLATFKPDLILQISRMRYENDAMPRGVPFICWDQDNLPCMRTEKATASLDALTYVAGQGATHGYTFLGWPRRNVIFCESAGATFRYTARPLNEHVLAPYQCDISFVSNASGRPEEMQAQQQASWKHHADGAAVYHQVSTLILQCMDAGGTWEYHPLLHEVRKASAARGLRLPPVVENELIVSLSLLSDRCFRHTALHWVRQWCEKAGKSLRLYGRGWDRHPDFAKYAAGYAQQGEGLAAIYQASKINLHLMESGGFFHSRPLDGIAAGGFFLTRTSPNDGADTRRVEAQRILAERAAVLGLSTKEDVARCGDPEVAAAWEVMSPFYTDLPGEGRITGLSLWNELPPPRVLFPQLSKISFSNAEEFESLAEHFLRNESERKMLAHSMRDTLEQKMSYACRWTQMLNGVRSGLNAAAVSMHNESLAVTTG